MRQPDGSRVLTLLAVPLCAGCGSFLRSSATGEIENSGKPAPHNHARQSHKSRRKFKSRHKLGLVQNRLHASQYRDAGRPALKNNATLVDVHALVATATSHLGNKRVVGDHSLDVARLAHLQGRGLNKYCTWRFVVARPVKSAPSFNRITADPHRGGPAIAPTNSDNCAVQAPDTEPGNASTLASMTRYEHAHQHYFEAHAFTKPRLTAVPVTASVLQLAIQIEVGLGDKAAASQYRQRLGEEFPNRQPHSWGLTRCDQ